MDPKTSVQPKKCASIASRIAVPMLALSSLLLPSCGPQEEASGEAPIRQRELTREDKLKILLSDLESTGKDLFGVWHSWQIPDYKSGMSGMDILERSKEPHHPDFIAAFARRQRIDNEEQADDVLDKYFYIRVQYSEASSHLTNQTPQSGDRIDCILRDEKRLRGLIDDVIRPYFEPKK